MNKTINPSGSVVNTELLAALKGFVSHFNGAEINPDDWPLMHRARTAISNAEGEHKSTRAAELQLFQDHSIALSFVREIAGGCIDSDCGYCVSCRAVKWLNQVEKPPAVDSTEQWLSVKEYAAIRRVHVQTVYSAIRRGKFQYAVDRIGGAIRICVSRESIRERIAS
jgi:hypothetical protein